MKLSFLLGLLATAGLASSNLVNSPPPSKKVSNTPSVDKDENSSSKEVQQIPVFLPPQGPFSDGPVPPVDPPKKIKPQPDEPKPSEPEPPVVWKPASWQPENPAASSGESDQHDTPVDPEPVVIDAFRALLVADRKSAEPKNLDSIPLKSHDKRSYDVKEKHINVAPKATKPKASSKDVTSAQITPAPSENNNDWGLGVGPVIIPADHVHKGTPIVPKIPLVNSQEHVKIGEQRRLRPNFWKEHQFDRVNDGRELQKVEHFPNFNHHKKEKEHRRFIPFKDQQEIRFHGDNQQKEGKKYFQFGDSMYQHEHELKHSQMQDSHRQHNNVQKTEKQVKHFDRPEFSAQQDHVQWEQREKQRQQQWEQHKQQWEQQHRANWEKWQKGHGSKLN